MLWSRHIAIPSCRLVLAVLLVIAVACAVRAAEQVDGPVLADVVKVIDGDSLLVSAHIWPGQRVDVAVRLRGIDAPEMRARCAVERRMALKARTALGERIGHGPVSLRNIAGGKYFGRVLADVVLADGSDLATFLLANAPVRAYGGGRRGQWCVSGDRLNQGHDLRGGPHG